MRCQHNHRLFGGGRHRILRVIALLDQLQNLPQNHMAHLEDARSLVRSGDYALLSALYDSVLEVLSELIRTAFSLLLIKQLFFTHIPCYLRLGFLLIANSFI